MKGPASGYRQPTFPSIVSASRSLHWCRQCIVADGSGSARHVGRSLVRAFHEGRQRKVLPLILPWALTLSSRCSGGKIFRFRLGNGEHAARGIKAREARAAAARAGGHAASSGHDTPGPITKCPPYKTTDPLATPEAGCGGHDGMLTAGASSKPAHQSVQFLPAFVVRDHGMNPYRKWYSSQEEQQKLPSIIWGKQNYAEERNKKRRVADVRFSFRVAHLLLPAVRTNPKRNLPHLALGGCTRATLRSPQGGHPLFLASRRASDGFASAVIWVIDEPRLALCDQCIGLRGEPRLRHSLYMGTFDVGDCKSMVLQFLLDRFSSKKFCQCYHFAGGKPSARNDASSAGLSQTNAIREPLLQCSGCSIARIRAA